MYSSKSVKFFMTGKAQLGRATTAEVVTYDRQA
jgi:hypothetical protein